MISDLRALANKLGATKEQFLSVNNCNNIKEAFCNLICELNEMNINELNYLKECLASKQSNILKVSNATKKYEYNSTILNKKN